MVTVFVTRPEFPAPQSWEGGYVKAFSEELRVHARVTHKVVERAEDAEVIILVESNKHKSFKSIPRFLQEPMLTGFCSKVCSINYEDKPAGFLRGLYTSLEGDKFDPSIHKSWPAFYLPNEKVYEVDESLLWHTQPRHLFSFVGSISHPLRRRLIDRFCAPNLLYKVSESKSWYNHSSEENHSYIDTVLSSHFTLCPRGHACYTHRIAEVMALGRVPVIIADQWIPFSIPEKDYFIRVAETAVGDLDAILAARRPEAEALGRQARRVWLRYFAKATRAQAAADAARDLVAETTEPLTLAVYRRRWHSAHFRRVNQMQLWQRAWRKCKNLAQKK